MWYTVFNIFSPSLYDVIQGGQYVLTLLDKHGAPISILLICFLECIAVSWFYGVYPYFIQLNKYNSPLQLPIFT